MPSLDSLPTPALVLDLDRLESNLRRMAGRARQLGVALRPHAKTHKCVEIARRQAALGARGITVSTLHEAALFIDHGFTDLTWAFPLVLGRIEEVRRLAARATLRLVVDCEEAVAALEAVGDPFHVWLEVDCGDHRSGVDPGGAVAARLARRLARSPTLRFDGLLTHSGQAYAVSSPDELAGVGERERRVMTDLADRLRGLGIEVPAVSVGSTPALSAVERLDGVDEARPGNYAFYDLTQVVLGACGVADCALTVLASVVSSTPADGRSVIDAGALALSKDPGPRTAPRPGFGAVIESYADGRLSPDLHLTRLSQEHGVLSAPLAPGTRVRILPNHSCLAAACFDEYAVVRGAEEVARWKIWRGRS